MDLFNLDMPNKRLKVVLTKDGELRVGEIDKANELDGRGIEYESLSHTPIYLAYYRFGSPSYGNFIWITGWGDI